MTFHTKAAMYKVHANNYVSTHIIAYDDRTNINELINNWNDIFKDRSKFEFISELDVKKAIYTRSELGDNIANNYKLLDDKIYHSICIKRDVL